jgi:glycosyltransferase involved in cell wall biosynthesis
VSAARNRGVAAADGQLVAFLDSDDLWHPDKLRVQTEFMQHRPELLICQTDEIWIRRGVRVNPGRRHGKPSGMIFEPSLALCLVSPSAVMLRRGLFEAMQGFDETLPACEDYDLWLRIACRHPIDLLPQALVTKRGGHADQLSRMPALDRFRIASLARLIRRGGLTPGQSRAALATLRQKCAIFAQGCRRRGRLEEAAYYLELPASLRPSGQFPPAAGRPA